MAGEKSNGPSENLELAPLPAYDAASTSSAAGINKPKRRSSKKTVGTILVAIITSAVTSFFTVTTGWLNYPLEKKKLELTNELQKQLGEHDKKFEAALEKIKAQIGLEFTQPRLIAEGVTKQQLEEEAKIRHLITRISDQFVTAAATESTKVLAGQSDSQQLWELLQNCHLPASATEGTRQFHKHVQTFLQRYSDKDYPRYPSPEAESALNIERSLRSKAIEDLNRWIEQPSGQH